MFKKLRTVIYHVDDLEKATAWYTKATGIEPYFEESFYVGFNINGFELGLDPDMTEAEEGSRAVAYWAVDDIATAFKTLLEAGGITIKDILDVGGGMQVAIVKDPFGNAIGLIQES